MSNSALRSPDGDQARPLEEFTFGLYSRMRFSRELCSATPSGTILAKVKGVKGSSLSELRSEWLVALCMHQDQVVAISPWTKEGRKLKQFVAYELKDGLNWHQFFGLAEAGSFRASMKIPGENVEKDSVCILPMPVQTATPRIHLKSKDMVKGVRTMDFELFDETVVDGDAERGDANCAAAQLVAAIGKTGVPSQVRR